MEPAEQFLFPEEAYVTTQEQDNLIKLLRKKYSEQQLTDLQCLQFARRHELDSNPEEAILNGVETYFQTNEPYKDIRWDSPIENEELIKSNMPIFGYGQDVQGHPVFYCPMGKVNVNWIGETDQRLSEVKEAWLRTYLRLFHANEVFSKERDLVQYQCLFVLDFDQIGIWNVVQYITTITRLTSNLNKLYPEVAYKTLNINTPVMLSWVTDAIMPFFGSRTKDRIEFSSDASLLHKYVAPSQRPPCYEGDASVPIRLLDYVRAKLHKGEPSFN